VGAVAPAVLVSFMAAFAIVRGLGRFLGSVNSLFLMGLAIPLQATIIPVYLIIIRLHLYDSLLAIILPSIAFAIPLSVLVLSNFIRDVGTLRVDADGRGQRVEDATEPGVLIDSTCAGNRHDLQRPGDLERVPPAARSYLESGQADPATRVVDVPGSVQHQRSHGPRVGRTDQQVMGDICSRKERRLRFITLHRAH
jgi:hypothetical protein